MVRALACISSVGLCSCAIVAQPSGLTPRFGTVEIRASAPNTILRMRSGFSRGRYELANATTADLIRTAWSLDDDGVAGGPDWLDTDRFDLIATAPAGSTPAILRTMLQGLLEERFHLLTHKDTRMAPAYSVTVEKRSRLHPSDGSDETGCRVPPFRNPILFECRNITMAAFIEGLPRMPGASAYLFNYRVVDQTGLKGAWDFSVKWSMPNPAAPGRAAGNAITLFDAFENQLGLRLKLTKVPTPMVVVDRVAKPAVTETLAAHPMEFEVADIKPAGPGARGSNVGTQPSGQVRVEMTLKGLIQEAWGDLNPLRIIGGPKSIDETQWVVVAKAPRVELAGGGIMNGVDINTMRMMLRALLVDRFKLAAHTEDRMVAGYALVSAKPKLRQADPSNRPGCKDGPGADGKDPRFAHLVASKLVTCRNMTLAQFATALSAWNPEETILFGFPPVVDATRIEGRYDITINFTPPRVFQSIAVATANGDRVASEADGAISIFEALETQLGLKLESRKVSAQVLVIDHVNEMPTDN
jgi:uncharacterized protein (TIGR03435 family)